MSELESKLDKVFDRLNSIDTTLVKQHESLLYHIKRTDILEKQVDPIKAHVDELKGVVKFIKIIVALAAIAESLKIVLK